MTDPIRHVVVLIMENHSFDQMLGSLKAVYPQMEGLDSGNLGSNMDSNGITYTQQPTTERQMLLDPHHEVPHVKTQLENQNGGFVKDFVKFFPKSTPKDRQFIMGYYPLGFLPSLHALAQDFTICDHWFSSLPGPTWPNRFFALTGTASGRVAMPGDGTYVVDLPGWFNQDQPTIFDRLNEKGIPWRVYFHDAPQTWALLHQREPENVARYFYINRFHADARGLADDFPMFCLIEPSFMGFDENDDHPPHDIMKAEKLIADVYNSIRANPELWKSTLFVVFYDEHGGFYDHVVPPPAIPPDDHHEQYTFDQFGLRVPAILISPWVKKGVEKTQFDHTSVLKYLIEKWGLNGLGRRTAAATSIGVAIQSSEPPRDDTIERIELTADQLTPPDPSIEESAGAVESAHHKALVELAGYLKSEIAEVIPMVATRSQVVQAIIDFIDSFVAYFRGESKSPPTRLNISPTQPDHISGKQGQSALIHQQFTQFLIAQKTKSVSVLGQKIRDNSLPMPQREHAIRTLASITGRKFHAAATVDTVSVGAAQSATSSPAADIFKIPAELAVGAAPPPTRQQLVSTLGTAAAIAAADAWLKSNNL